jgi:hypothetical protein
MEANTFKERLIRAAQETIVRSRDYVVDQLPEYCVYIVFPNKHGEAKKLMGDAEVFPEDSLPPGQFVGPLDSNGVTQYLWRNWKMPEWIDLHVKAVEENKTVIQLRCCGHFTSLPTNGYNEMVDPDFADHTPFSIKGPIFPQGWKRGDPKFALKDSEPYD